MNGQSLCTDNHCLEESRKIAKNELRIGRRYPSFFGSQQGIAVNWFHPKCMFNQMTRARTSTQVIQRPEDIDHFFELPSNHQDFLLNLIQDFTTGDVPTSSGRKKSSSKSSSSVSKTIDKSASEKRPKRKEQNRRDAGRILML